MKAFLARLAFKFGRSLIEKKEQKLNEKEQGK